MGVLCDVDTVRHKIQFDQGESKSEPADGSWYEVVADFGAIIYQVTPNLKASDNLCTRETLAMPIALVRRVYLLLLI